MNCTNLTRLFAGLFLVLTALPLCASPAASAGEIATIGEQSGFIRTGRYDEVEKLCAAFSARWYDKARCFEFGRSKAEFERRLRDDAAFAGSPGARLEFFYRRHPSRDERYDLYPVYRK
jgi:hypothetical protein